MTSSNQMSEWTKTWTKPPWSAWSNLVHNTLDQALTSTKSEMHRLVHAKPGPIQTTPPLTCGFTLVHLVPPTGVVRASAHAHTHTREGGDRA